MGKKIVYVVGGLLAPNGMAQVLSQKINYLAENTDFKIYMILTEKAGEPWYYEISKKVEWVNFDINFDELDTMPTLKKLWHFRGKQARYKRMFTDYLMKIRPDITVSACRREINFINDIPDGSVKVGEIHFSRKYYRKFNKKWLPGFVNRFISKIWIKQFEDETKRLRKFVLLSNGDRKEWKGYDNIQVIYNPVKWLSNVFSDGNSKRVVAVGRYTYQKGFDLLFKAWQKVEPKHPDWRLEIFGQGDYEGYQKDAESLGLTTVTCHPSVRDIYEEYVKSSIFVLSSRYEGFGLVIVEAMSCGVAPISFACESGPEDIITDGVNGCLAIDGDTDDLADKINFLMENEDKRRMMAKNAIERAKDFSQDTIMKQWIDLFNSL